MHKKQEQNTFNINNSDMPYPVLINGSRIELIGNTKMFIEGKYMIIEYSSELVKFKLAKKNLLIIGQKLLLNNVESEGFIVTGNIVSIQFE